MSYNTIVKLIMKTTKTEDPIQIVPDSHAKTGQLILTLAIDSKDKVNTLRQYVITTRSATNSRGNLLLSRNTHANVDA